MNARQWCVVVWLLLASVLASFKGDHGTGAILAGLSLTVIALGRP